MVDGELFFFAAFLLEPEQKPFPARIIVFDFQVHDGTDPGESVGEDPEQSAIAEPRVRGCVDRAQKRFNFTFGVLPSVRENLDETATLSTACEWSFL